jgi:hypothetical protein
MLLSRCLLDDVACDAIGYRFSEGRCNRGQRTHPRSNIAHACCAQRCPCPAFTLCAERPFIRSLCAVSAAAAAVAAAALSCLSRYFVPTLMPAFLVVFKYLKQTRTGKKKVD